MITRMLHLGILTLTAFQYSKAGNITDVFDIFNGGDKYAITALAYNVNQNDEIRTAVSWVATLPLWWGAGKAGLITYLISRQPEKEIDKTITKLSANDCCCSLNSLKRLATLACLESLSICFAISC